MLAKVADKGVFEGMVCSCGHPVHGNEAQGLCRQKHASLVLRSTPTFDYNLNDTPVSMTSVATLLHAMNAWRVLGGLGSELEIWCLGLATSFMQ